MSTVENPEIVVMADDANLLHKKLQEGFKATTFPEPNFDSPIFKELLNLDDPLLKDIGSLSIEDLTERKFGGLGVFDAIMESIHSHMDKYFRDGLIDKPDIPKVVSSSIEAALGASVQFVLNKDQAAMQALDAKYKAINTAMQLENTKATIKVTMMQGFNEEARYANIKMDTLYKKSSIEKTEYEVENILPITKDKLIQETANLKADELNTKEDTKVATQNIINLKTQDEGIKEQTKKTSEEIKQITKRTDMMTTEEDLVKANIKVAEEQVEVTRAQTMDTRTDTIPVTGYIGKQKLLLDSQNKAYKNDGEYKLAQLYANAYMAQAASDGGIKPPNEFTQTRIDAVLSTVKTNLGV